MLIKDKHGHVRSYDLQNKGDYVDIQPGQVHWGHVVGPKAKAKPAQILVVNTPAWSPENHLVVPEPI